MTDIQDHHVARALTGEQAPASSGRKYTRGGGAEPPHDHRSVFARLKGRLRAWQTAKLTSPAFQRWAAGFWLTRPMVRRDSAKIYDLVAGFVYSQTLLACVELGVLDRLADGPLRLDALAHKTGLPVDRARRLAQAASALGLLERQGPEGNERYALARLGAAVLGVPGLTDMIRHHAVFYRDLRDPVGLLQGQTAPELAKFWPYVLGGQAAENPTQAAQYSDLMATSQTLVAEETLDALDFSGIRHLADIGGGTGAFLAQVAARYARIELTLFDLPAVAPAARERIEAHALTTRIRLQPGHFLDDPLPDTADAISLIRVLYDHDDPVVERLLSRIYAALPPGGRIILSEPMSGGTDPTRSGDAYFNFYTLAMTTGQPRSADQHMALLDRTGFTGARIHRVRRPFLTGVITAQKPS